MRMKLIALTIATLGIAAELAHAQSQSQAMSFEACLMLIDKTAADFGVTPITIVQTGTVRMVRFIVADGSVLITCSAPDQKVVITRSSRRY